MRILKFNIVNQTIFKDPVCDFMGLVTGSQNYLKCKFTFDDSWNDTRRVVEFSTKDITKYFELDAQNESDIPSEITAAPYFKVSVHGFRGKEQFETNKVLVRQGRSM